MTLARPVGHDLPRAWLKHALQTGRLAGSYLFVGPSGIGKAGVALEFAASMRCEAAAGWACGQCNECVRVARGVHPSVRRFVRPADKSDFPVELVREIVDQASLKQLEPGRRVFIIEDADRFNESSANAFLKTLEEPPPGLHFVLVAGNLAQVLPTILSRCQSVRFSSLDLGTVLRIAREWEGMPESPDSRTLLARVAQGSPGRLRAMLDAGVLETAREFWKAVSADPFRAAEVLAATLQEADEGEAKRDRLREILALLTAALRDRMLAALACDDLPALTRPVTNEPRNPDALVNAMQRIDDLRERVDGNANLKLVCDAIALAWP